MNHERDSSHITQITPFKLSNQSVVPIVHDKNGWKEDGRPDLNIKVKKSKRCRIAGGMLQKTTAKMLNI